MSIAQLPLPLEIFLATATLSLVGTDNHWDVYATSLGEAVRLQDYAHPDEPPATWREANLQLAQLEILQNYARSGGAGYTHEDWLRILTQLLDPNYFDLD